MLSTLKTDLKTWLKERANNSELQGAWARINAAARTDRKTRKAHLAAIHAKHGRDWRRPLAWGLLTVAGIWIAAWLIMGSQKIGPGLFDLYAGQENRGHQVIRPVLPPSQPARQTNPAPPCATERSGPAGTVGRGVIFANPCHP